ncbi:MAG: hypothetical protein L0Y70_04950, partial [Gemmataceae bacterium]|nr:hypothetical protein [Gemmataceae bacterium]
MDEPAAAKNKAPAIEPDETTPAVPEQTPPSITNQDAATKPNVAVTTPSTDDASDNESQPKLPVVDEPADTVASTGTNAADKSSFSPVKTEATSADPPAQPRAR